MTDPLEQLREEIDFWRHRNLSPTASEKVEFGVVVVNTDYLISRLSALEAVLAMLKEIAPELATKQSFEWHQGYNSALSEVHSLIAGKLGGGEE